MQRSPVKEVIKILFYIRLVKIIIISYLCVCVCVGNCSINSISHSIKANSTTITNTEGEAHNMSQFSLRNTTKSFFDLREVIIPEKFNTINQLKSQYVLKETNNIHNDQCEMDNETEGDNLTNIKDNMSVNIKDITKKRRSISDLVQRYKKVLEITKENIECEN